MYQYSIKAPGRKAFISTCRLETALFAALGYSIRKIKVEA